MLSIILIVLYISLALRVSIYFAAPHMAEEVCRLFPGEAYMAEHASNQCIRKKELTRMVWTVAILVFATMTGVVLILRNVQDSFAMKVPDELKTPRVVTSMLGLKKEVYLSDQRLGRITDIVFNKDRAVFAGDGGALIRESGAERFVGFERGQDDINFIRIDKADAFGFMNRGSWAHDARLMDIEGRVLWRYGGSSGVDDMASGDVDGDGYPEYVVGFNGGGGIHLLDQHGRKIWQFDDGNVWHVEIGDIFGDGHNYIVHSNAGGEVTVRDISGKVISSAKPSAYFSSFSLIRWPDAAGSARLLYAEDNRIWILDARGTVLAKFTAPGSGSLGEARGAVLEYNKGKVLGTVIDYKNWKRTLLFIHDGNGNILYREILPESCKSIVIIPGEEKGFLIGGEGRIIKYSLD